MLSKIPLFCLQVGVKTERNFLRLAEITPKGKNAGRELLLTCAGCCFTGLGVGFFMFLRLGPPATHELTGYMVGLFMMAGLKLGYSLRMISRYVTPLIDHCRR